MDLALFDLDETLIDDDSASLWIRWLVGQGFAPAELELQEQQLMQLYYQGKLSMEDYMQATLAPLTGLSVQTVAGWVQRYIRRDILPRVYPAARERLQWHRERGDCILVIPPPASTWWRRSPNSSAPTMRWRSAWKSATAASPATPTAP